MYLKTVFLTAICLLALPSATALSTIGVDVDYDIPLYEGDRLEGGVSLYIVPEDDGDVTIWQDTNECDGIQQNETDECGEADSRVYPREAQRHEEEQERKEEHSGEEGCQTEHPSIPEECNEEGPSTDPYPAPENHPDTTARS